MEKQHNRGQDGAGLANIKFDVEPGQRYISRTRSVDQQAIQDVFKRINSRIHEIELNNPKHLKDVEFMKKMQGSQENYFLATFDMELLGGIALKIVILF